MIRERLCRNVVIELPRIGDSSKKWRSLKNRKAIRIETLQIAKAICAGLNLPKIKIEVWGNIKEHPFYRKGDLAFYFAPSEIPSGYSVERGAALIVIQENENEFLISLFHELGHALEPKDFKEEYAELWAWFFAYIILREEGRMRDAAYCWKEVLAYEENLKFGVKKERKRLTKKS